MRDIERGGRSHRDIARWYGGELTHMRAELAATRLPVGRPTQGLSQGGYVQCVDHSAVARAAGFTGDIYHTHALIAAKIVDHDGCATLLGAWRGCVYGEAHRRAGEHRHDPRLQCGQATRNGGRNGVRAPLPVPATLQALDCGRLVSVMVLRRKARHAASHRIAP